MPVSSCILTFWLYCSLVFIPGLKEKDFLFIIKSLELIVQCSGINRNGLDDCILRNYFEACGGFSNRVI